MNRTKVIVLIVAAVVVIAAAIFLSKNTGVKTRINTEPGTQTSNNPGDSGYAGPTSTTRGEVPDNVVVPGTTSTVSGDVAKPTNVIQVRPDGSSLREFKIQASGNDFNPSTIIVKQGDSIQISLTAVDKDYDFTQPDYGFNTKVSKGQTRTFPFDATAGGKFTFFCKSCGGPGTGPVGYIIVSN
jgi:heme/copper-type cytochrome/quinol oxidase subunit 2